MSVQVRLHENFNIRIMEILKIFSDQYDEERLYCVLMTEGELFKLFSYKDYVDKSLLDEIDRLEKNPPFGGYSPTWAHDKIIEQIQTSDHLEELRAKYPNQFAAFNSAAIRSKDKKKKKRLGFK